MARVAFAPGLRQQMERNVARFLQHLNTHQGMVPGANGEQGTDNHNWKRVTRIIRSLNELGLGDLSERFHSEALKAARRQNVALPEFVLGHWDAASRGGAAPTKRVRHPVTGQRPLTDMPTSIYLLGRDERTLEALRRGLGGEIRKGRVEAQTFPPGTAIVSPANSFGWMDGGIDGAYMTMFGDQIQRRVQDEMKNLFGTDPQNHTSGMPIGEAFIIRTYPEGTSIPNGKPEWLIVAPTMIRPGRQLAQGAARPAATPDVAGKALEAALRVAVPGMGMGTAAGVEYNAFAKAFGEAYDRVDEETFG
jgi:O-acetyl-ADP-ribose deacetylase (regulator of RNase III)